MWIYVCAWAEWALIGLAVVGLSVPFAVASIIDGLAMAWGFLRRRVGEWRAILTGKWDESAFRDGFR